MRPIRPEDEGLYPDFFKDVTPEDLRLRFFAPIKDFSHAFLAKLTQLDYERAIAFAAIESDTGRLLGVVRLHADPDHITGEYAILLRSNLKGQGLGWKLMKLMIEWAKADGLSAVKGEILRENRTMISMCEALGFSVKSSPDDESIAVVTLPISAVVDPAGLP
jgi:acetyltransferase